MRFRLIMIAIVFVAVIAACAGQFFVSELATTQQPTPRFTAIPAAQWSHTAVVRVNDEQGIPMGTDAHVWADAARTNLKVACTIPRGQTVDIKILQVINGSVRVRYRSCEGWIGMVQLDKIEPK